MKLNVFNFYKKDKKAQARRSKDFFKKQYLDFFLSYIFIFLSSSEHIFSLLNGAVWVFLWYTLAILMSWHSYISSCEYNDAVKRAKHRARTHKNDIVETGKKCNPEIGGWTFIGSQIVCAMILACPFIIFAFIYQNYSYESYINDYKTFCLGIFADTYIIAFFNVYYNGIVGDLISTSGWKKKADYLLHTFYKSKFLNIIVHILAVTILVCAFVYYFLNEFSGLFNPTCRKILGLIYILYMLGVHNILIRFARKIKNLLLPKKM